ncbi:transposase domain-containing protein [Sulfobacillus thermosulfidooxidans]|uniref:Uncharacterized protein n=1 Tax=Sulfobacillus benefaciens TaxID=453960 RepID=A0A2T2WKA2_9FIRM|nr:MAG: hypothetical protein C7B43_20610 [Sulfobacillus benefaciens]
MNGNRWHGFPENGRLEVDSNCSERAIKSFVTGRKNCLYANTPRGAQASAITLSLIQTAKENDLEPRAYLPYLFEQLPQRDLSNAPSRADCLLWSPTLPRPTLKRHPLRLPPNNKTESLPQGGTHFTLTYKP